MIFKSIRWRLQIWYGLILVTVLAGFGLTAYRLERSRQLRHIDEALEARVTALARALPPPPRGGRGPFEGPPGSRPPRDFPPPEPPPDGYPGEPPRRPPPLRLSPQQAGLFEGGQSNGFYYVSWFRTGEEVDRSASAPTNVPRPDRSDTGAATPVRTRGLYREAYHFTPPGECLLAGRSITADLADLRRFAWWLTVVGAAVLALGLVGGGWLAARAIQPIETISGTAVKIAAGDLSQRINIADTDNELGRLADVLNSTFARLEAAFSQQGRFTSDAAHELRNPVFVILTQTQAALARERTALEFRKTVETCQRTAERMRRLIESLLELARLDAGQESMTRAHFDLADTVGDCVELLQPLAKERGIKIECALSTLDCAGDPERLGQVVTNLLSNAIQYNKDEGEVRVTAHRQNGLIVLSVADTGPGIAVEDLPRVFDRFYRGDKSRSSAAGRTGLGLAISKAIVTAHGGSLEASSQPGLGATFTLRLPAEAFRKPDPQANS